MLLEDLPQGASTWVAPAALGQDQDGILWIARTADGRPWPDETRTIRVVRHADGCDVDRVYCRGLEAPELAVSPATHFPAFDVTSYREI